MPAETDRPLRGPRYQWIARPQRPWFYVARATGRGGNDRVMTDDNLPEIPKDLIDAAANGTLVVVVGEGASIEASPKGPDWKGFVDRLRTEVIQRTSLEGADRDALEELDDPIRIASHCRRIDEDSYREVVGRWSAPSGNANQRPTTSR